MSSRGNASGTRGRLVSAGSGKRQAAARARATAGPQKPKGGGPARAPSTRNLGQREGPPRLSPSTRLSVKMTRQQQQDMKFLQSKADTYTKQVRVYGKLEARATARSDAAGAKFYRLMQHAAQSQLDVLAHLRGEAAAIKGARAAERAAADTRKAQQMAGGKAARPNPAMRGSAATWARTQPPESITNWALKDVAESGKFTDEAMNKIAAEMGFGTKPYTATKGQMDKIIGQFGGTELYRGFSSGVKPGQTKADAQAQAKAYAKDAMKGAYRASYGQQGSGIYFGIGPDAKASARSYASTKGTWGGTRQTQMGGVLVRAALMPGARIADGTAIMGQMFRESRTFLADHGGVSSSTQLSPADQAQYNLYYIDPGRYAASKGYDAIVSGNGEVADILNRGAVIFQSRVSKVR